VREGEAAALISVILSSGTGQTARVWQYVPLCSRAYWGEDACVASQPGQPGVEPGAARCGPAIAGVMRWQTRQAPARHPPDVRGLPAPGSYLAAAPKPRRAQLRLGWPMSQSSLQLPVLVSALPWA